MKDNVGGLITGILIHDNIERNRRIDDAVKHTKQNIAIDNMNNKLKKQAEEIKKIKKEQQADSDSSDLVINYYRGLLSQPMQSIAENSEDFKKTYEEQQTLLADWMVSQKAFKELAIQFGKQLGKTPDQVKEMGLDKEIDVLQDKNDPNHGTNVGDSTIIGPRREVLLDKAQKAKAARKAKKSS